MLKTAPDPIDVQDLQFKLRCRLKIFDNTNDSNFSKHCSLVTCASRFGLIFVGTNTSSLQAIKLKSIEECTVNNVDKADYSRRILPLPSSPTHLSVNCEHTILAVVVEKNSSSCALFYNVKSFWEENVAQIGEVRLSATPSVHVTEVNWNPALGAIFTACKSDGSLGIYDIKGPGSIDLNELPAAAGTTCFCWSPKGKQIAVGSRDGKITQYKPDLKAVKVINAPPLKEPHSLQSLQWVSNYQFIGVFQPINPDNPANCIVVDAPKTGDPTYISYDDICYSNGNTRPVQFYSVLLQSWNILMVASSNSMEVGILGNTGECWTQWIMGDAARAELPLSAKHHETLPIGCALDIGNTQPLQWGESTLPPPPFLLLLSHHGVLCCFNVVNLKNGIPTVCTPPDPIKESGGLQHFVTVGVQSKSNVEAPVKEPSKPQAQVTPLPTLDQPKQPTATNTPPSAATLFKLQPITTTPPQGLNQTPTSSITLFGGQAVLTPISQAAKTTTSSHFVSPFQTLQTSLPTTESKKNTPSSEVQLVIPSVSATVTPKPAVNSISYEIPDITPKISQPEQVSSEDLNKTETINVDFKAEEEAEKIFAQMVREECIFLESELKAVLYQGRSLKPNLGTDEDKDRIVQSTQALEEFFNEMSDICTTQNAEVHILKQNLLQSWAWYEEVKSRHLAFEDESLLILMRSQPLDSASEKQLEDIRHANYYLESQIAQAHVALDEQWENFQDYCKKTHKIQIPTMEMIFQTMVKQNAILRKQNYVLKDIANRIKSKSRSTLGPSLVITKDDIKDLPEELKKLRMDPEDICMLQQEHVMNRMKNFTKKKADNLRSFLKKREYPHISIIKPQLSSSIIQASPSTKLKYISLSTMSTPPSKIHSTKSFGFVQSTPKATDTKYDPSSPQIQPTTPIDGLQKFTLNFQDKNFANIPEKTFTPLNKNVIAGSPKSAFVSTSLVSSASTPASVSYKSTFMGATTTSAVIKTTPSFVLATNTVTPQTTSTSTSFNKPFALVTSKPSATAQETTISNVPKSGVNVFANAKSTFSFNLATTAQTSTSGSATIPKTTATVVNVTTTKPTSSIFSGFKSTKITTSADSSTGIFAKPPASVLNTQVVSSGAAFSQFSFAAGGTSSTVFASANQKTPESTAVTKPVLFATKTTTATSPITQKRSVATTQPIATVVQVTKAAGTSLPPAFSTAAITTPKTAAVPTPPLFSSTAPASTATAATVAQSSIFGSTAATTTSAAIFPMGNIKSSIFPSSSVAPKVSTAAAATSVVSSISSTTAATSTSIFSTSPTTSQQSIFGSIISSTTPQSSPSVTTGFMFGGTATSKPSIFGNSDANTSKPSLFGTTASTTHAPSTFGTSITSTSIFGATPDTSSSTGFAASSTTTAFKIAPSASSTSVFGAAPSSTSPNVFGAATTSTTSVFGGTPSSTPSVFGATPSTVSVFGATPSTSASPVFGATPSTSASTIFGATISTSAATAFGATPSTTAATVFGATPSTTAATVFGATPSTTAATVFGATPSTTAATVFGAAPASAATGFGSSSSAITPSVFGSSSASVFGAPSTTSTASSIFGAPATSSFGVFGDTTQKPSLFGSAPSTNTTQPSSIFGSPSPSSPFGTATTTTSSIFGQSQPVFGQAPAFGSSGSTFGSGSTSIFGASPTFGQATGSLFGSAPTTSSGSVFGAATTTTGSTFGSTGSVFGSPASTTPSVFGSASVFSPATQSSTFAANTNSGSFGFGGLNVGSTTTSSSVFGGAQTANPFGGDNKNIFGSSSGASSSSVFGSSGGSLFGNPPQSPFGGTTFGSQPSSFGQQSTFGGQSAFGSSTFGQQTSGPFSGGGSPTVGQSGFGGSPTFQKPAFGSAPVFGSSPTFGSAPSFGGAAAFGSAGSTFGNTSKIFGGGSPGFGTAAAASSQTANFGNLANQPTVGFGNLAQQAANAASPGTPFSGGSSSFSSWR